VDRTDEEGLDTRALRGSLEKRLFGDAAEATHVGRFRILRSLGRGGMGVVYAAHDPQLDREVALKLLHQDRRRESSASSQDLLAEARALARLTHPHVVTIYETGLHEGALFLAMEFFDGDTLASWGHDHPVRTRRQALHTVALYRRAGEGLAAAHAAGLVHRDFKPANVLLGSDGRLAVADFGLARGPSATIEELGDWDQETTGDRMATATLAGTPAYMAPEQLDGEVDERSDQFSFCVSLWEALYRVRPFVGTSPLALRSRMLDGEAPSVPSDSPVPRRIHRALLRGLALDPTARWPSMRALLDELSHDSTARRRQLLLGATAVGALALAAWQPWRAEGAPCDSKDDPLEVAWGEGPRAEVTEALTRINAERGRQTVDRVQRRLDTYATQWRELQQQRCEASLVRRERSQEAYDLTMACLLLRRDELTTLTTALANPDEDTLRNAVAASAALTPIDTCGDVTTLRQDDPSADPARRAALAAFDRSLIAVRVQLDTGKHAEALDTAQSVVATARTLEDDDRLGRALERLAVAYYNNSRFEDAQPAIEEAIGAAARAGNAGLEVRLWPMLIRVVGAELEQAERGRAWALPAQAALARSGQRPTDTADLHHALGAVAFEAREFDVAEREHLAALAIRREHLADDKLGLASSLNRLAGVYHGRRDLEAAESVMLEVVQTFVEALGPDHPRVGTVLYNLGGIYAMQGRYDEAIQRYERAIEIYASVYGPRSARYAGALANMAAVLGRAGRNDDAIVNGEQALEVFKEVLGEDNPKLAAVYNNLGAAYDAADRLEDSLQAHVKAIALVEHGGPSPELAINLSNLGLMQAALDRPEEAAKSYERSIEIYEQALDEEHPDLWRPLAMYARLHRKAGRFEQALPLAERAVAVLEGHNIQPIEVADAHFELARILREAGREPERAKQLATKALGLWKGTDEASAAIVERWLADPAER